MGRGAGARETRETIPPEHILFVVEDDTPVATACVMLFLKEAGTEAVLGWVSVPSLGTLSKPPEAISPAEVWRGAGGRLPFPLL